MMLEFGWRIKETKTAKYAYRQKTWFVSFQINTPWRCRLNVSDELNFCYDRFLVTLSSQNKKKCEEIMSIPSEWQLFQLQIFWMGSSTLDNVMIFTMWPEAVITSHNTLWLNDFFYMNFDIIRFRFFFHHIYPLAKNIF